MFQPQSIYTQVAWQAMKAQFHNKQLQGLRQQVPPPELQIRRACFVSLHLLNDDLRGCMGTIEPVKPNLYQEIISNALSAARHDTRFQPLRKSELDNIALSVDVLSLPEPVTELDTLDPQRYGLIISDGAYRKGVLLPALEQIQTVAEQIRIAKKKAGLSDTPNTLLQFQRFTAKRYH